MAHAYGKLYITLWIYIRHRIKTYASIECVFACKRWRTRKSALCSQRRLLSRVFFFLLLLLMPEVIKNLIKRNSYGRLLSWAALCSTEEGFHSIETDLEKSSSSRVSFRFKFFPHVFCVSAFIFLQLPLSLYLCSSSFVFSEHRLSPQFHLSVTQFTIQSCFIRILKDRRYVLSAFVVLMNENNLMALLINMSHPLMLICRDSFSVNSIGR